MQVLAQDNENSSLRVNSIDPGPTRTGLRLQAFPAEDPQSLHTPEQRMPLYLWLMGPDSIGTTGQAFSADRLPPEWPDQVASE